ncbi:hypothetical protein BrE312_0918 [Brenneria sp. EniD312]|nr:hypothetical protein BrE312_0918 [Brenneria sp. EniD312]
MKKARSSEYFNEVNIFSSLTLIFYYFIAANQKDVNVIIVIRIYDNCIITFLLKSHNIYVYYPEYVMFLISRLSA